MKMLPIRMALHPFSYRPLLVLHPSQYHHKASHPVKTSSITAAVFITNFPILCVIYGCLLHQYTNLHSEIFHPRLRIFSEFTISKYFDREHKTSTNVPAPKDTLSPTQ